MVEVKLLHTREDAYAEFVNEYHFYPSFKELQNN
jgi:hypothetical protein